MTFNLSTNKSILKFDGKLWRNRTKVPSMFIVNNNTIFPNISDNHDENKILVVLNSEIFEKFLSHFFSNQSILNNQIKIPKEINCHTFLYNFNKFNNDFHSIEVIGKGGFGSVYSAINRMDLHKYAVKQVIFKYDKFHEDKLREILKEFRILAKLNHGNIVRYHTAWLEKMEQTDIDSSQSNTSRISKSTVNVSLSNISNSQCQNSNLINRSSEYSKFSTYSSLSKNTNFSSNSNDTSESSSSNVIQSDIGISNYIPTNSDERIIFQYSTDSFNEINNNQSLSCEKDNSTNGALKLYQKPNINHKEMKFALYIQMELCQSNLKDWLINRNEHIGPLNEVDRRNTRSLARQLLRGVEYLHANKIIHRDIKPANIFLSTHSNNGQEPEFQLKIGDFGLAKSIEYDWNESVIVRNEKLTSNVGTAFYIAPEVFHLKIKRLHYNHKCDLYSMGVILLELMLKVITASELYKLVSSICTGIKCQILFDTWPIEASHITSLISIDPLQRHEAQFILNQACFKEIISESGIYDTVKELTLENTRLQKLNESLLRELEKLRLSLHSSK